MMSARTVIGAFVILVLATLERDASADDEVRLTYVHTQVVRNCDGQRKVSKSNEKHELLWKKAGDGTVTVTLVQGGAAPDPVLTGKVTGKSVDASGTRTLTVMGRESTRKFELHGTVDREGKLREGKIRMGDPDCYYENSIRVTSR